MADIFDKKKMLFLGMLLQGVTLFLMIYAITFWQFAILSSLLGIGTAIVYPTFLAGIGDYTHPEQRAQSIGIFRLWRDSGYAFGAIITGVISDIWDINTSIALIGGLTILSALIIQTRMDTNVNKND